jgi:YD repeat-containing protein
VYLYDAENRLIERRTATSSACPATGYAGTLQTALAYDPLGRLVESSSGGAAVTRYSHDGDELSADVAYTSGTLTGITWYVRKTG